MYKGMVFSKNNIKMKGKNLKEVAENTVQLNKRKTIVYPLFSLFHCDCFRLRDGIRNILSISRLGNQYIQANKPWVLVKGTPQEK